jgi:hypothetical protein
VQGGASAEPHPRAAFSLQFRGIIAAAASCCQPAQVFGVQPQRDPAHGCLTVGIGGYRRLLRHGYILPAARDWSMRVLVHLIIRSRIARIQRQPALIAGLLGQTGLTLESQPALAPRPRAFKPCSAQVSWAS